MPLRHLWMPLRHLWMPLGVLPSFKSNMIYINAQLHSLFQASIDSSVEQRRTLDPANAGSSHGVGEPISKKCKFFLLIEDKII